jgi:hypothetical protein
MIALLTKYLLDRARTYPGIARCMAAQWGSIPEEIA